MSHAYSRNYVHIVFSTKDRRPWIRDSSAMWAKLAEIAATYGVSFLEINGTQDHIHILIDLPPKIAVATLVRALKADSSKWMNESEHLFAWQQGYASLSVSASNFDAVADYIRTQPQQHAKRSFEDEYSTLLRKHGINFTPEKVFG